MSADFAIIIIHLHVNKIAPELPQNRSEVTEFQGFVRIERDYYGGNFRLGRLDNDVVDVDALGFVV